MILLPEYVAIELGWFESYKVLTVLNERAKHGEEISFMEKQNALAIPKNCIDKWEKGIDKSTLETFIEEWKTNEIAKTSCSKDEKTGSKEQKWKEILTELEAILQAVNDIEKDGYDQEATRDAILKTAQLLTIHKKFNTLDEATQNVLKGLKEPS